MLKKLLFLLQSLFLLSISIAQATHIVGGELTMVHVSGNQYIIGLNMYFDAVNGEPGAIDQTINISTFSRSSNQFIQSFNAPIVADQFVPYTNPDCAVGSLVTRQIVYAVQVTLDPNQYNEVQGYYMSWERCCRNHIIDNIVNPGNAGQAFYLEFPSLIRSGEQFINSSPTIFNPVSDYACVNQPFVFDFSGTDPDGDELRYELRVPLNGSSTPAAGNVAPVGVPGPYREVTFVGGIGINNMIPGNPPLSISPDGLLVMTPSRAGLFVFAIGVEEYRNGIKIGEVRREFQIQVLDCPSADPPELQLFADQLPTAYREGQILRYQVEEGKCETLEIMDVNSATIISAEVHPINFSDGVSISPSGGNIDGINDKLNLEVCFPQCPMPNGENYLMDLVIGDNSCPFPLFDTLRVEIEIVQPPNDKPEVSTSANFDQASNCYTERVVLGEAFSLDVFADDENNDTLQVSAFGNGFELAALKMQFEEQVGLPRLTSSFTWNTDCRDRELLLGDADSVEFELFFVAEDRRKCEQVSESDTTCLKLTLVAPTEDNILPELTTSLTFDTNLNMYCDSVKAGDLVNFDIFGNDEDGDSLVLKLFSNVAAAQIAPTTDFAPLTSRFSWQTACEDLTSPTDTSEFFFDFVLTDYDVCTQEEGGKDTTRVKIILLPEINQAPTITTNDLEFDETTQVFCDTLNLLEQLSFTVLGDDPDQDTVSIEAVGVGFNLEDVGMQFQNATGKAPLSIDFQWSTSCADLERLDVNEPYFIDFTITDQSDCDEVKQEIMRVKLVLNFDEIVNDAPEVSTSLDFDANSNLYCDTVLVDEAIDFRVLVEDLQADTVLLEALGEGFSLESLGMQFENVTGKAPQHSDFSWTPSCMMLAENGEDQAYFLNFVANEQRTDCTDALGDTIRVKIVVSRGENPPPTVTTSLTFDPTQGVYLADIQVNTPLNFDVLGDDPNGDIIFLDAEGEGFDLASVGMNFTPVNGVAPQQAPFSWTPDCLFLAGASEREVFVLVRVSDLPNCNSSNAETARVKITVRDVEKIDDFLPPNVFTPNNDGKNDTFHIPNLPPDTCTDEFLRITIYNRWGKEVFESENREFEWDGNGFPSGVYFYTIKFQSGDFKGSVSLIRGE